MTAHIHAACPAEIAGRRGGKLHICVASRATAREQKFLIPGGCFHPKGSKLFGTKNRRG